MQRMNPAGRSVASCGGAMVVVVGLAALAPAQPADREQREKATPTGVTDMIAVAGGGEIRGAVVKRFPDGTLDVAVQRDWLDAHAPEAAGVLFSASFFPFSRTPTRSPPARRMKTLS